MIENKKAQLPLLGLFSSGMLWVFVAVIAILFLVVTVAIGKIILSPKFIMNVAGIGLIVLTFMYAVPAALSGKFTKQKAWFVIGLIGVGAVLVFLGSGIVLNQAFGGTGTVYYPQYGNMECRLAAADYNLYEKTGQTTPITIKCGDNMNAYTNFCKFQISFKGSNILSVFDNVKFETCNNAGNCKYISGTKTLSGYFDVYSINLDTNQDGYLDSADGDIYSTIKITPGSGWFSSTTYDVRVLGNAYRMYDTQGNGYVTTYAQGCVLSAAPSNLHETVIPSKLNYQDSSNQIPFGGVVNYVWGITPGITSNVIQHNSKWVYIEKAGFYSPILTSPDGYNYVDWHQQIPDATIQCVPSNVFNCNSDATLRTTPSQNVEGQDCSLIRGVNPNDFLKASTGQCCKFSCVNNKIVTSECQTCVTCAAGTTYNAQTNSCVNPIDTGNQNINNGICNTPFETPVTVNSYKTFWGIQYGSPTQTATCQTAGWIYAVILGAVVIIIVIIYVVTMKPTKKGKRK